MKACNKCGISKKLSEFYKNKRIKDGLCSSCKDCVKKYLAKRLWSEYQKTYQVEYRKKYWPQRMKEDEQFRIANKIRNRVWLLIKRETEKGKSVADIGCTGLELKVHLQARFKEGMTWSNKGRRKKGWEVDHIKPLSSFDLTDRKQYLKACNYKNLRPLWRDENRGLTKKS